MNPNDIPPELLSETFKTLSEAARLHIADLASRYSCDMLNRAAEARRCADEQMAAKARAADEFERARRDAAAAGADPDTVRLIPRRWNPMWVARTPEGLPLAMSARGYAQAWGPPSATDDVGPGPELEHRVGRGQKWWSAERRHNGVTAWRVKP